MTWGFYIYSIINEKNHNKEYENDMKIISNGMKRYSHIIHSKSIKQMREIVLFPTINVEDRKLLVLIIQNLNMTIEDGFKIIMYNYVITIYTDAPTKSRRIRLTRSTMINVLRNYQEYCESINGAIYKHLPLLSLERGKYICSKSLNNVILNYINRERYHDLDNIYRQERTTRYVNPMNGQQILLVCLESVLLCLDKTINIIDIRKPGFRDVNKHGLASIPSCLEWVINLIDPTQTIDWEDTNIKKCCGTVLFTQLTNMALNILLAYSRFSPPSFDNEGFSERKFIPISKDIKIPKCNYQESLRYIFGDNNIKEAENTLSYGSKYINADYVLFDKDRIKYDPLLINMKTFKSIISATLKAILVKECLLVQYSAIFGNNGLFKTSKCTKFYIYITQELSQFSMERAINKLPHSILSDIIYHIGSYDQGTYIILNQPLSKVLNYETILYSHMEDVNYKQHGTKTRFHFIFMCYLLCMQYTNITFSKKCLITRMLLFRDERSRIYYNGSRINLDMIEYDKETIDIFFKHFSRLCNQTFSKNIKEKNGNANNIEVPIMSLYNFTSILCPHYIKLSILFKIDEKLKVKYEEEYIKAEKRYNDIISGDQYRTSLDGINDHLNHMDIDKQYHREDMDVDSTNTEICLEKLYRTDKDKYKQRHDKYMERESTSTYNHVENDQNNSNNDSINEEEGANLSFMLVIDLMRECKSMMMDSDYIMIKFSNDMEKYLERLNYGRKKNKDVVTWYNLSRYIGPIIFLNTCTHSTSDTILDNKEGFDVLKREMEIIIKKNASTNTTHHGKKKNPVNIASIIKERNITLDKFCLIMIQLLEIQEKGIGGLIIKYILSNDACNEEDIHIHHDNHDKSHTIYNIQKKCHFNSFKLPIYDDSHDVSTLVDKKIITSSRLRHMILSRSIRVDQFLDNAFDIVQKRCKVSLKVLPLIYVIYLFNSLIEIIIFFLFFFLFLK